MDVSNTAKDYEHFSDPLCTDRMINASEAPSEEHGKFARIKQWFRFENSNQRKNFVTTMVVYFNIMLLGWTYGQLTTAFPDIQLILNTNVQQTSLIFTMNSVGYMLGSLAMGYFYDKVNHLRLLGVISVINGLSSIVLPWCNIYELFMFVRLVDGFLCGGRGGGGDATVLSRWGTESRHLTQGNHLSYGLGGVLAPLVTRLFLAPRVPPTSINTTGQDGLGNFSDVWNTTATPNDTDSLSNISKISQSLYSSFEESDVVYGETKIHIAFVITGIVNIISGMLYLYLYMKKYDTIPPYTKSTVKHEVVYHRAKLTTAETSFCIFLIGMMFITFCSVESKSQSFLLPFVMLQMGWTKFDGAYLLSLLWGFFTAGRFTGVIIARFLSPRKLACICLCTVIVSYMVLSVGGLLGINAIIWTTVPFVGFGLSAVFPTFVVWTHENAIEVKGKMSGFFQFVGAIGFFTDPFYIGYLIENESPMYMMYIGIAQATCSLIIFISTSLWINSRKVKAKE